MILSVPSCVMPGTYGENVEFLPEVQQLIRVLARTGFLPEGGY